MVFARRLYWVFKTYGLLGFWRRASYELLKLIGYFRHFEERSVKHIKAGSHELLPLPLRIPALSLANSTSLKDGVGPLRSCTDQAEGILKGKIKYFGGPFVECGFPPDWFGQYSGERQSMPHWSEIETIVRGQSDIKLTWEPSRFLFVFPLARAYVSTKEERFAEAFWKTFESWQDSNPAYLGPNWLCGQEAAIRVIAWSFGFSVFSGAKATTTPRLERLRDMLLLHMARILETRNYALSQRNNHAISEAVGILTIASLLPEHAMSCEWEKTALDQLEKVIADQFDEDGAYIQHSFNYHRFALELLIWTVFLLKQRQREIPILIKEALIRSLDFLEAFMDPLSGFLPQYGSDDGTLLLDLTDCERRDFRPVLQSISIFCGKGRVFSQGLWDELAMWLFENQEYGKIEKDEYSLRSRSFHESGYHVLRGPTSHLFVRGARYRTRPGQADNLHIDFWFGGKNILFDPGTFSYNPSEPRWDYLSGSFAHNVAGLVGHDQMEKMGSFVWLDWTEAFPVVEWKEDDLEYLEIRQFAYKDVLGGVFQRRGILRHLDAYWVLDSIRTKKESDFFIGFNLFCEPRLKESELLFSNCPSFSIRCISSTPVENFLFHGQEDTAFGWRATTYQKIEPGWRFERRQKGTKCNHVTALGDPRWVEKTRLGDKAQPELPEELKLIVQFENDRKPLVEHRSR